MSELKVHRFITTDELFPEANAGVLYYEKSEADKWIAYLEESHKMEVEQLLMEIAELEEERRWRKCSEELPKDGAEVLAADGDEIWLCRKDTICDGSPWFQPDGLPQIEGVTHWRPLPSAPKEDK